MLTLVVSRSIGRSEAVSGRVAPRASPRLRLPVAVAVAACAVVVAPASSAGAATAGPCRDRSGVTVVVEPAALGGAPEVACVPVKPGETATDLFDEAGHAFTRVSSMPDVVCRIDDRPKDAGCAQMPPANAYWSLWVADIHGRWTYATRNVNEITVTSGGGVAFRWVDGNVAQAPATELADAVGAPASPSPVPSPAAKPVSAPSGGRGPATLPGWVAPALVVVVGAGAVLLWRRRA